MGLGHSGCSEVMGKFLARTLEATTSQFQSGVRDLGFWKWGEDDDLTIDFGWGCEFGGRDDGAECDRGKILNEK